MTHRARGMRPGPLSKEHTVRKTLKVRPGGYARLAAARKWRDVQHAAHSIGISKSTLGRALNGDAEPGAAVVAGLMAATVRTRLGFFDLFEIIDPPTQGA